MFINIAIPSTCNTKSGVLSGAQSVEREKMQEQELSKHRAQCKSRESICPRSQTQSLTLNNQVFGVRGSIRTKPVVLNKQNKIKYVFILTCK